MKIVNLAIYDFDGTLYPGDTLKKFWIWSLKHHVKTWFLFPQVFVFLKLYIFGVISKDVLKQKVMLSLKESTLKKDLKAFWQTQKPFSWVKKQFESDRKKGYTIVCISASPEVLLQPLTQKLKWDVLIGSPTEKKSPLKLSGKSARGEQKIVYLNAWAKKNKVTYKVISMFSDRLVDKPLLDLAEEKYAVPKDGRFYAGLPRK
ncbi:MAG: haloacid dehalogenase-like hydrolase [Alphaproteobacteria bacterium]|nr:haloacid dehalogenase-like hydrolase [Alphaproteobacteria bacterium]